jgi:hypothetical protein
MGDAKARSPTPPESSSVGNAEEGEERRCASTARWGLAPAVRCYNRIIVHHPARQVCVRDGHAVGTSAGGDDPAAKAGPRRSGAGNAVVIKPPKGGTPSHRAAHRRPCYGEAGVAPLASSTSSRRLESGPVVRVPPPSTHRAVRNGVRSRVDLRWGRLRLRSRSPDRVLKGRDGALAGNAPVHRVRRRRPRTPGAVEGAMVAKMRALNRRARAPPPTRFYVKKKKKKKEKKKK